MEDVMKILEENENNYYKVDNITLNNANEDDDIFKNEEHELKKFDLFKAKVQMKKVIQKQVWFLYSKNDNNLIRLQRKYKNHF